MKENTYWGHHLIINAAGCIPDTIKDSITIYNFTKQLVKDIDMVAYGEPQIVNFGSGNKAGYTLVQLIETSNICAHFVNEYNEIYLDVFSCKSFDKIVVENLVRQFFGATNLESTLVDRKAPNP